jgi:restriction endonuclease S subunit
MQQVLMSDSVIINLFFFFPGGLKELLWVAKRIGTFDDQRRTLEDRLCVKKRKKEKRGKKDMADVKRSKSRRFFVQNPMIGSVQVTAKGSL